MKSLFILLVIIICGIDVNAQVEKSKVSLFGQCMFSIEKESELDSLKMEIASNPNVEMVRLDFINQRAFIITKNIDALSPNEFRSWFGKYESTVDCIQIGVRGVDPMDPFPFKNCKNN